MSLEYTKVYIHGRLRGLTKRRIAQLVSASLAKMARRPSQATLLVLGHSSAASTLLDDGELDFAFDTPQQAAFTSERRFKSQLGIVSPRSAGERNYSSNQLTRHSGLSERQIRSLALYDILDPVDGSFSYRDLIAARTIGRLVSSGASLAKIAAAALALELHGVDLATARLSESSWGEILQEIEGRPARLDGQLLLPLQGDDIDANDAFARAEASEADGDLADAVRWYELAARLDQEDPVIPFNLGNALDAMGEPGKAEIAYRQAIGRSPELADAWFNLGVLQERTERYKDALVSYEQATIAEPSYRDALFNSAALLMRLQRFAEALTLWERLAESMEGAAEAKRLAHLCRLELNAAARR
jgi:tetratricopeptide (TPR) repeat protein